MCDNNADYVQRRTQSVERLMKMMINNGYKTIVIVGGDSALNDSVNCADGCRKEFFDQISLGVYPNGFDE